MLENNHKKVTTNLSKGILKNNKKKFGIILFTIMLSTFMLFSVLTTGITYLQMKKEQTIRFQGADYNAVLGSGFTEEQKKKLEESNLVDSVGVSGYVGYADIKKDYEKHYIDMRWSDDVHWNKQKHLARRMFVGEYPKEENEVIVAKEMLEESNYKDLNVGDEIELKYIVKAGEYTKVFIISGIYSEYPDPTSSYRSESIYVSQSFYEQYGFQSDDVGILFIKFSTSFISKQKIHDLEESLQLNNKQYFGTTSEIQNSISMVVGVIGVTTAICLSAYLLIYNILYLFISGNIRYYGLLQVIGMDDKQIRKLLRKQIYWIGGIGIIFGLVLGILTSFYLLPFILENWGIEIEIINSTFQPIILCGSIVLITLAIYFGMRKPIQMATNIELIEALHYQQNNLQKNALLNKKQKSSLLWHMAKIQLLKDKKKTIMVILSLTISLSMFLSLITMISMQNRSAKELVREYMYMEADLSISNDNRIDKNVTMGELTKYLDNHQGIKEWVLSMESKVIIEPSEFIENWFTKYEENNQYNIMPYQEEEHILETYRKNPESFPSIIAGISETEFEYINQSLDIPIDKEAFLKGEVCIVYNIFGLLDKDENKQYISYYFRDNRENTYQMEAVVSSAPYVYSTQIAPTIIISDMFLQQSTDQYTFTNINIFYHKNFDKKTESEIASLLTKEYSLSYNSCIENLQQLKETQGNVFEVGVGIVSLILIVGVLNYINTVSTNIQIQSGTLATMESIGMTQKQVKQMLISEGLLIAIGSIILTSTIGLAITYFIYQKMNYLSVPFIIPVVPVIIIIVVIIIICTGIPVLTYEILMDKESLTEKIRDFQ